MPLNLVLRRQKHVYLCEFETRLICRLSPSTCSKATEIPCLNKPEEKNAFTMFSPLIFDNLKLNTPLSILSRWVQNFIPELHYIKIMEALTPPIQFSNSSKSQEGHKITWLSTEYRASNFQNKTKQYCQRNLAD